MMKGQISARDYELLSAYLDRQLNPRERAGLEARLQTNPQLSTALEDLRKTHLLLRSLPRPRRPRSFMLSPQMVAGRQPQARPLFPAFSLASALSSLLLVLVLLGDFLGLAPRAVQLAAPEMAQPVAMEVSTEAAADAATEQEYAAEAPSEPTELPGPVVGAAGMPSETPSPKLPPTEVTELPFSSQLVEPSPTPLDIVGITAGSPEGQPTPTISVTQDVAITRTLSVTVTVTVTATPGADNLTVTLTAEADLLSMAAEAPTLPPTDTPLAPTATEEAVSQDRQFNAQPTSPPVPGGAQVESQPTLRTVEIVLAIVAVLTGLAAFFLRRGAGR